MISTLNLSHFEPVEKRSRFTKSIDFVVEVGVIQIGYLSKQMVCDMIYQLSLTRYFFPTNFHSNLNTIKKILTYLFRLDIYPGAVGVAAIKMYLSQQILLMTFFITKIIEGTVSAILITCHV